jgi:hypothetical protein
VEIAVPGAAGGGRVAGAVGGFYVLETDDLDAAVAIASGIPQAGQGGAFEIRPSARYW